MSDGNSQKPSTVMMNATTLSDLRKWSDRRRTCSTLSGSLVEWSDVHEPREGAPEFGIRLEHWPDPDTISVDGCEHTAGTDCDDCEKADTGCRLGFLPSSFVMDEEHLICWLPEIHVEDLERGAVVYYAKETWEQRTRRLLRLGEPDGDD